ncbi:MAG: glycosyltransferase family 4 protein [Ignavibacteriales bacterium]|nr:glycosyltransferase family 4 protein [Ignavibacteriales bacterium]
MKILIFNWQDIKNPLGGGAEVHLHQIFSRVAKMGHEVTLYCSSFEGAPSMETIDGIKIIREGGRNLFNLYVPWRYFTRFRKERFDLVIDDMNKIPFFTPLYVREPLFFIIHHLFDKSIFRETSFPVALYVYLMEKLGVAVAKWKKIPLMVVSESTKQEMLRHGYRRDDITFAFNCVDHKVHYLPSVVRKSKNLIGYFGRLKKYKSVDHLLQAFVRIKRELPDASLVIVGDGDYRLQLESLANALGISSSVRFTGYVSEEEKVRLLQEMLFMVNTSAKEGWGLTVIEANACGTPVVGSNVPGLRDAIKNDETGLLYEYGNIEELSYKMLSLLKDEMLRKKLTEGAIAWSKTFDWDVVAQQTIEIMQKRIS